MCIDPDKRPTSLAHVIYCRGIKLVSRYRQQHEFELLMLMAEAINGMLPDAGVSEIFCDSKATHAYSVTCKPTWERHVGDLVECICVAKEGGHNTIVVNELWFDPKWDEEVVIDDSA
jgi:hypothetical protein